MHSATAEAPVSYIRQRWKATQDRNSRVFVTHLLLIWPHHPSRISDDTETLLQITVFWVVIPCIVGHHGSAEDRSLNIYRHHHQNLKAKCFFIKTLEVLYCSHSHLPLDSVVYSSASYVFKTNSWKILPDIAQQELHDSQSQETVKYNHESRGTRDQEWLYRPGPATIYATN
jgi:hypothetical protein